MTALTSEKKNKHTHTTHSITVVTHGNSHWYKSCDTAEKVTMLPKFVRFATECFWASLQDVPDWEGRASPQQGCVQAQKAVKGLLGFKGNPHMHSSPARQMTKPSSNPTWILLSAQPHVLYS